MSKAPVLATVWRTVKQKLFKDCSKAKEPQAGHHACSCMRGYLSLVNRAGLRTPWSVLRGFESLSPHQFVIKPWGLNSFLGTALQFLRPLYPPAFAFGYTVHENSVFVGPLSHFLKTEYQKKQSWVSTSTPHQSPPHHHHPKFEFLSCMVRK